METARTRNEQPMGARKLVLLGARSQPGVIGFRYGMLRGACSVERLRLERKRPPKKLWPLRVGAFFVSTHHPTRFGKVVSKAWRAGRAGRRLRLIGNGQPGSFRRETGARPQPLAIAVAPAVAGCKGLLLDSLLELVSGRASPICPAPPQPLASRSHDRRPRRLQGAPLLAPQKGWTLDERDDAAKACGPSEHRRQEDCRTQSPSHRNAIRSRPRADLPRAHPRGRGADQDPARLCPPSLVSGRAWLSCGLILAGRPRRFLEVGRDIPPVLR